jgi:ArsR family transcriptional regulator
MDKKSKSCCLNPKDLSPLFKALSDENRITILNHLCQCARETNVGDISTCCNVDLSVVSRHLSILKENGILLAEKRGKEVFYRVNSKELVKSLRSIADFIENCTC